MVTVVVFGQKPWNHARLLGSLLTGYGGVILHLPDSLGTAGEGSPRFLVTAVSRMEQFTLPRSVLLLADQTSPRRLELSEDTVVVASADNRRLRRLLGGRPNPVVTCGTGAQDSVTLSSAAGNRLLMCAQRKLPTAHGKWMEPAEFVINTDGCGIREALLTAGAAAVCGCDLTSGENIIRLKC